MSDSVRVWRFVVEDGALWFYGSVHTYRLWPNPMRTDRDNW